MVCYRNKKNIKEVHPVYTLISLNLGTYEFVRTRAQLFINLQLQLDSVGWGCIDPVV